MLALHPFRAIGARARCGAKAISAAVSDLTYVTSEINGLLTCDRMPKLRLDQIWQIASLLV